MTDFQMVQGFEDVWRPPVRQRIVRPRTVLRPSPGSGGGARARLERIAGRAPEPFNFRKGLRIQTLVETIQTSSRQSCWQEVA